MEDYLVNIRWLKQIKEDSFLEVKIQTNSSTTSLEILSNDSLKLKVRSLAKNNKANIEVINFFKKTLKIPRLNIEIVKGQYSSFKVLKLKNTASKKVYTILSSSIINKP